MKIGNLELKYGVILAPMAGVTDQSFRAICREMGCELTYTEMISAKGLLYGSQRTEKLLQTHACERPCGVQIFGSDPQILADRARWIEEHYAGEVGIIDLNMGCPALKIVRNGEGSALMKNPILVGRIVEAVAKSVQLPVSIKIRKGWDDEHVNALEVARIAQQSGAAAVTVHGRTREQQYAGKADWETIAEVKSQLAIPVIGNGDIFSAQDAVRMMEETGCDGVMVARGAQGNPFIFREILAAMQGKEVVLPTVGEKLDVALAHLSAMVLNKGEKRGVIEMRKHVAWYLKGCPMAAKVRRAANEACTQEQMEAVLRQALPV